MISVLIADDENSIREGLKHILDWDALDCTIVGDAATGDEALNEIIRLKPDLVLMDIRMPGLTGIEVISSAKKAGFNGRFIIISGYSDFTYAKEAIHLGVESYITKPVDEDELEATVLKVKAELADELVKKNSYANYRAKARNTILLDILNNNLVPDTQLCSDLGFKSNMYRVVIYENYSVKVSKNEYSFSDLLRVTNQDNNSYEIVNDESRDIIILKSRFSIDRFNDFLSHYEEMPPQPGSPLDMVFLAYGRIVEKPSDIHLSFEDVNSLITRRFFCLQGQHTLGPDELPKINLARPDISRTIMDDYAKKLSDYIQSFNRNKVAETLFSLENYLFDLVSSCEDIKLALADMYLQIKEMIKLAYPHEAIPFPSNSEIISLIENKNYLYEIIQYFGEQFEMIMNASGNSSKDSLFDDILYYIDHNYTSNIKLETIAPLFGYNSAYLGKIFSKNVGENFNSYVDHVRIERSKKLLMENRMKVYEISEAVGYRNVDYFHKKFKKYEGISPAEYRRSLGMNDSE